MRPILLDVTNSSHIEGAFDAISGSNLPSVAILNNAGIGPAGPVELLTLDEMQQTMDVGYWAVTRYELDSRHCEIKYVSETECTTSVS